MGEIMEWAKAIVESKASVALLALLLFFVTASLLWRNIHKYREWIEEELEKAKHHNRLCEARTVKLTHLALRILSIAKIAAGRRAIADLEEVEMELTSMISNEIQEAAAMIEYFRAKTQMHDATP